jgi:hypothetical protein
MRALFGLLLLAGSAAATAADDAALSRCRAIAAGAGRLACYDAIELGAPRAATAPATGALSIQQQQERFGLENRAPTAAQEPAQVKSLDSHIEGDFDGWGPRGSIRLANGQVWRVSDDSQAVLDLHNPKVRVVRGLLGSGHYLEIEGTNHAPRVVRLK